MKDPSEDPLHDDEELRQVLGALYPDEPAAPPAALWRKLEPDVRALAGRRRLRAAFSEIFSRWQVRLTVAALFVCLAAAALLAGRRPPVNQEVVALEASAGESRAVLTSGASLVLVSGSAELQQTDPAHDRVILLSGELNAQVPILGRSRSLTVRTAEADVIVHGTRFTVKRGSEETVVQVLEGLVEVRPRGGDRQPVWLHPGEELSVLEVSKWVGLQWTQLQPRLDRMECGKVEADYARLLTLPGRGQDVGLAEYVLAYCAAERGDATRAVGLFERAAQHATDPIRADNALARAAQLSRGLGAPAHAEAWRRYLVRFPDGTHRALAEDELRTLGADR